MNRFISSRAFSALAVVLMVGAAAVLAAWSERWLDPQSLAIIFVIPIVIAAVEFGFASSFGAALLSSLALNYLFVEPRYTFVVTRAQDVAALILFTSVGLLASAIGARVRAAALDASQREKQASTLTDLATQLGAASSIDDVATLAVRCAEGATGRPAAVIAVDGKAWGAELDASAAELGRWSMSTKQPYPPAGAPSGTDWVFWPIKVAGRCEMALGVRTKTRSASGADLMFEHIAAQAGLALARVREAAAATSARLETERERLKSELLAGVSHDLRTPLSSIVLTLESLQKFAAEHSGEVRQELLALAHDETRKLASMVDELLDASRLGENASPVHLERLNVIEIVRAAREAVRPDQAARLDVDIASDHPPVVADRQLSVRALSNLITNALSHGGKGRVQITASQAGGATMLTVRDHGPGLGEDPERCFGKFVRGAASDGRKPGLGLGLVLARKFMEAQGAKLTAANASGGGAAFTVTFGGDADHGS